MKKEIQLIYHGFQIEGRKCFSFYVNDLDLFIAVAGAQTFDTFKEFSELATIAKWPKRRIKVYERIYKQWVKDN
jgi:hypothetical protein